MDLLLQPYVQKLDTMVRTTGTPPRWTVPPLPSVDPEFHGSSADAVMSWLSSQLAQRRLGTIDMHSGNVGFLGGRPVVLDLGSVYPKEL